MVFKHKLSVRLALLKDPLLLVCIVAFFACEKPVSLSGPGPVVTRVVVSPRQVALRPNQTSHFMAVGLTATGDTGNIPVTWSATGGSIVDTFSTGSRHYATYQPSAIAGNYLVIATDPPAATVADTSTVTIMRVPVASVTLSPAVSAILLGATVQLTATAQDSTGIVLPDRSVTWSSSAPTVATVSASGLVTAVTVGSAAITATSEGKTATAAITITTVPVASVAVSPASATIAVGSTQQLSAVTKDAAGTTLTGRVVTWSSDNTSVASVSGTGLVLGQTAGSATITATSEGKSGSSAITVQPLSPASHAGYYVTPSGSASGDGSASRPWDLQTALNQPAAVQPGDTIWLRGGTYSGQFSSALAGTSSSPIIVRQYPGERATINGTLFIQRGAYTWFWGFEVTAFAPNSGGLALIYQQTPGSKLINLVVHDASRSGIISNPLSPNSEIYGCLVYNNGVVFNLDHGLYLTNTTGTKLLRDNIVFNNWKYGFHLNGNGGELTNLHLDGNVAFGNGSISNPPISQSASITLAGASATGFQFTNNYTYETATSPNGAAEFVVSGSNHVDGLISGNTFVHYVEFTNWNSLTVTNNTFFAPGGASIGPDQVLSTTGSLAGFTWATNSHYRSPGASGWGTSDRGGFTTLAGWMSATGMGRNDLNPGTTPTGPQVSVRLNVYEAGRANIIVYNWGQLPTVSVDLSSVLRVGDTYQVRNAQDFYGAPAASGVYAGGLLTLPT